MSSMDGRLDGAPAIELPPADALRAVVERVGTPTRPVRQQRGTAPEGIRHPVLHGEGR